MNPEWKTRYEVAIEAARTAGQIASKYFDVEVAVEWKQDHSPVTVADREAEQFLRATLLGRFPYDGFVGEEFGTHEGSSGYRWYIDPIDGTRSFVRGIPIWGTLVGLEYQGECIAGVIVMPALGGVTYRALRGDGAYRDERRLHVSPVNTLGKAHLYYSSVSWFAKGACREAFLRLVEHTERQRGFGDFYGFVLVAQGSGELMIENGVHSWDVAAVLPIIEEAGGTFSDWTGARTIHRPDVLISNGLLHEEVLKWLRPTLEAE
ncbi:MAG: inositol monophosphatase family protein [Gemmataceae bacterium]